MNIPDAWLIEKLRQEREAQERRDHDSWVNQPTLEIHPWRPPEPEVGGTPKSDRGVDTVVEYRC